jgi:UPF0271 protein
LRRLDLNCDIGEGESPAELEKDLRLMEFVTSVNIACGYHAGNRQVMEATAIAAGERGIAIGAHPSYDDRANFGRVETKASPKEVHRVVISQLTELSDVCHRHGLKLNHVKPHGALYNRSARDGETAEAIAEAVHAFDRDLILVGLSGSKSLEAGQRVGLQVAAEAFADRTYLDDGSLTPRSDGRAMIENVEESVNQISSIVNRGIVTSINGNAVAIAADTICIHGDGANAVEFAGALHSLISAQGFELSAMRRK